MPNAAANVAATAVVTSGSRRRQASGTAEATSSAMPHHRSDGSPSLRAVIAALVTWRTAIEAARRASPALGSNPIAGGQRRRPGRRSSIRATVPPDCVEVVRRAADVRSPVRGRPRPLRGLMTANPAVRTVGAMPSTVLDPPASELGSPHPSHPHRPPVAWLPVLLVVAGKMALDLYASPRY